MLSLGRVFGLKDFVGPVNCSSPNALVLNTSHDWPVYVSPGVLLLLCYTVTSLLKLRKSHPSEQVSTCHPPSLGLPGSKQVSWCLLALAECGLSLVLSSAEEGSSRGG
jgi:hypothetical protein